MYSIVHKKKTLVWCFLRKLRQLPTRFKAVCSEEFTEFWQRSAWSSAVINSHPVAAAPVNGETYRTRTDSVGQPDLVCTRVTIGTFSFPAREQRCWNGRVRIMGCRNVSAAKWRHNERQSLSMWPTSALMTNNHNSNSLLLIGFNSLAPWV